MTVLTVGLQACSQLISLFSVLTQRHCSLFPASQLYIIYQGSTTSSISSILQVMAPGGRQVRLKLPEKMRTDKMIIHTVQAGTRTVHNTWN
jgi:hypothetical protein